MKKIRRALAIEMDAASRADNDGSRRWQRRVVLSCLVLLALSGLGQAVDGRRAADVPRPYAANQEISDLSHNLRARPGGRRALLDTIVDYIFAEKHGLDFQYARRPTLSAVDAMQARRGNCLTLVNLFVSLARGAGIRAVYVRVLDFETYYKQAGTIVRSNHVIGGVWLGSTLLTIDFLPDRPKRYRQLREISDAEASALFYNSLGSEALLEGDLERSEKLFQNAFTVLPGFAETHNNYAILKNRLGDKVAAVASLNRALELDPELLSAMENLAGIERQRGRGEEAAKLEQRILEMKTRNPYFLIQQALYRLEEGDPAAAAQLAHKAQRIEPEIPDTYVVLGRVELSEGDERQAQVYFKQAEKKSRDFSNLFRGELQNKINKLLKRNSDES